MPNNLFPSTPAYPDNVDALILPAVKLLNENGFKTFESCQGGEGHAFGEPTIRFEGSEFDLIRAYEICQFYQLPVSEVRRVFRKIPVPIKIDETNKEYVLLNQVWDTPFNEITFFADLLRN
jgi:hypothetical protein